MSQDPQTQRSFVEIDRPGGYDRLVLRHGPVPVPGPEEVVIACEACGVNYADGIIRMGLYASAKALHGYPIVPGFEVAGRIVALGKEVQGLWKIGDEVIGLTLFNGYTSHLVLPADGVFAKPANLDFCQAACLPTVFLTAWWMVHRQLHVQKNDHWLVHSAAGGVGSALCQLGRLAGVRVIGVVGAPHKIDHAKAMGADEVICRATDRLWDKAKALSPEGYQAIFDANGVDTLGQSYRHLAPTGSVVVYGFASMLPKNGRLNWVKLAWDWLRTPKFDPMKMTQQNRSVLAANLSFLQSHAPSLKEGMLWLLERFEAGTLQPLPLERHALEDAANAHKRIESGQSIGKLVLLPTKSQ